MPAITRRAHGMADRSYTQHRRPSTLHDRRCTPQIALARKRGTPHSHPSGHGLRGGTDAWLTSPNAVHRTRVVVVVLSAHDAAVLSCTVHPRARYAPLHGLSLSCSRMRSRERASCTRRVCSSSCSSCTRRRHSRPSLCLMFMDSRTRPTRASSPPGGASFLWCSAPGEVATPGDLVNC